MAEEGIISDPESDSDVEEFSGMEQPPLIKQLKTILAEYPDDGQIIKELVQNAEDAGASAMKILYDGRSLNKDGTTEVLYDRQHGDIKGQITIKKSKAKKWPYRKFLKAPALCFYNNGVFSEGDWRGIKMIYSSVKEEDPLKVGRFGLGFKSVFHITDYPCIISGTRILFMNPHEKVPGQVCITIKLKDLMKCKRIKVDELIAAMSDTFGFTEDNLKTGHYSGTIFWFPLRETPSDLSDTCYDRSKVLDLFRSFQSEAVHSLLFLKSLSKVELYCRGADSEYDLRNKEAFFSVELDDADNSIQQDRRKFLKNVKSACGSIPNEDIVCVAHPTFKTCYKTTSSSFHKEQISSWVVINVYKGGHLSEKLKQLINDKDLSYMPYVGAAVLLDDSDNPLKGHIFCFLPLPQEKKSLTGLPVHFNGFFALSQNRRHLKWASEDQETHHMHRDKSIEWNECLVNEVLPGVYMRLIKEMIARSDNKNNTQTAVEAVYKCIPDDTVVDSRWEGCVKELYQLLITADFIFVPKLCTWVQPNIPFYTMFDNQNISSDQRAVVMKLLKLHKDLKSAEVPKHIWEHLKRKAAPKDITPEELCQIIRSEDVYRDALSATERLQLLEYITKDMKKDGSVGLLQGFELLPLQNGEFAVFQEPGRNSSLLYYCTVEQAELFHGLDNKIVSKNIGQHLEEILQHLATTGKFQLRRVEVSDMVCLLNEIIQHNFSCDIPVRLTLSSYSWVADWIRKVWKCLFDNFSEVLSKFSNLSLMPCLISGSWEDETWKNGEIHLYNLNQNFLLQCDRDTETLPNDVCVAFKHLSVVVIPSLPGWIDSRNLTCIFNPTGPGLGRLFEKLYSETPQCIHDFNKNCELPEAEALNRLLDRLSDSMKGRALNFLQELKLFTLKTSSSDLNPVLSAVSEHGEMVNPEIRLPIRFPRPLLLPNNCLSLARKLEVVEVNEEQLVIDVLKAINKAFYEVHEIEEYMQWFLTQVFRFKDNKNIVIQASNITFVPAAGGGKFKPSDLYDPGDAQLIALFSGENKFPTREMADQHLQALKLLGLRSMEHLTPNCLYSVAKILDKMCKDRTEVAKIEEKAKAFLLTLERNHDLLNSTVVSTGMPLYQSVIELMCFKHQKERPIDYPECLDWKGSEFVLCSAGKLRGTGFTNIAGSVIPIIQTNSTEVSQVFKWHSYPEATVLTRQLENLIRAYNSKNKPSLLPLISNVYKTMMDRISDMFSCSEFQTLVQDKCVWWGDGFCFPDQIILERQNDDIDLRPYMFTLPCELEPLICFFERMQCNKHQNVHILLKVLEFMAEKYKSEPVKDIIEVQKDLELSLRILTKIFQDKVTQEQFGERLLIPVHTTCDGSLLLKPYSQCTYCDAQWLKELAENDDDSEEILYVHPIIPSHIAEGLGVKSLKMQLMSDAEGLEEWGQEEPLTIRIHNILKDGYVDGLAVPKEIIQNADDAGAKTVQFIYDERENLDARTQLLDEGMAGCQGPALWAYNDAVFSDSDFRNITKLSGASKEDDTTKIGKFGLGFCAVYNLTDVPSFISGHNMVIFDPNTTHLNKALPGNSPGLKINLKTMKNQRLLRRMNNQFRPFSDVFDCNLLTSDPSFDGTLFRLPLRTRAQAATSEIKNIAYSKAEMITLLTQLSEAAGNLLLFTQNLQEINVFHIPPAGVSPKDAILLYKITKEQIGQKQNSTILTECSKLKASKSLSTKPFTTLESVAIKVECTDHGGMLEKVKAGITKSQWLVSWATGTSRSLELSYSTNIKGALPLGSVAIPIESESETLCPLSLSDCPFGFYKTGHVFCYLPLPIESKFDFHVNGSFAVTSSRRGLQTSTEDEKHCNYDSMWNEALLSDAVSKAFINILLFIQEPEGLKFKYLSSDYKFCQLWPTKAESMKSFSSGFYRTVMEENSKVFQAYDSGSWHGLRECLFPDKRLVEDGKIKDNVLKTLQRFGYNAHTQNVVVDIPTEYLQQLQTVPGWKNHMHIVGQEEFFLAVLLPNIKNTFWEESEEMSKARISLMLYCLLHSTVKIDEKIRGTDCIPIFESHSLRKPENLVHPEGIVSSLFCESDGRFPTKEFRTPTILQKLVDLGMMKDFLLPDLVKERAMSIASLASRGENNDSLKRSKHFVYYLSRNAERHEKIIHELKDIPFLPVQNKPRHWPFRWKAETTVKFQKDNVNGCLDTPSNLFLSKCKKLVGCEEHILNSSVFGVRESQIVFEWMGVKTLSNVNIDTVISQLLIVCNETHNYSDIESKRTTDTVLDEIYHFLNTALAEHHTEVKKKLQDIRHQPVIRLGSAFLPSFKVVFSLPYDCSPELFGIGEDRLIRHRRFLEAIGVKEQIEIKSIIDILLKKNLVFQDTALPHNEFQCVIHLILCLSDLMFKAGLTYETVAEMYGEDNVLAPDISQILRPTYTLCFDDSDDVETTSLMKFIHQGVSRATAERLGVLTKKSKHIEDCSVEIPFEQKEELVTRLKRLLDGYPCDAAILKELIQNADDAGATEIHFLKDIRTHSCHHIFDDSFSEFQGPALCVFNDSSFSQSDLKGIQRLGVGNKSDDPAKTGQYGVGFNAVYNLTDLPSFLTKGPDIENGETLCILDPLNKHLKRRVGTRYINMRTVRKSYSDVFLGYNEKVFFTPERQTGTVFRFPLRSSPSGLSDNIISPADLDELFSSFQSNILELMFFLKHLTKITVSFISDKTHKIEQSIELNVSEEDLRQRKLFLGQYEMVARNVKEKQLSIWEIMPFHVCYQIKTKGSREDTWYIGQTVGIAKNDDVSQSVRSAVVEGKIGLLPVAGVAVRLPNNESKWLRETDTVHLEMNKNYLRIPGRAYCFLPLPGFTGLPFHINGHFILDHEARRGLWKREDKVDDYKSEWNQLVLNKLIPRAYVKALNFIRMEILFQNDTNNYTRQELSLNLLIYDTYFPSIRDSKDENWKAVSVGVLKDIVSNAENVFPVVEENYVEGSKKSYILHWNSVHPQDHKFPIYIPEADLQLSLYDPVLSLLRMIGMKIASVSKELRKSFEEAQVPLPALSSTDVIHFLKSYATTAVDKCRIDVIPCNIENTLLKTVKNVNHLLRKCSESKIFSEELDGLPLLVTNDGVLRCFSSETPVFFSVFDSLLQASADKFVHKKQRTFIRLETMKSVVRKFCVNDFAVLLPYEMPIEEYASKSFVCWNKLSPDEAWIKTVWKFLADDFVSSKSDVVDNKFDKFLRPVAEWCLIPATRADENHLLVSVKDAFSVIDLETFAPVIQTALKSLDLPCLLTACLSDAHQFISTHIVRTDVPVSLLICLKHYKDVVRKNDLDPEKALEILGYFSDNLEDMLQDKEIDDTWLQETLKYLPFYITKNGQCRSFEERNCKVLVIPNGVPEDGLEELAASTETVLLRNEIKISRLYKFLGFTKTERIDVYSEYILRHWNSLPDFDVFVHLKFVRDELLKISYNGEFGQKQKRVIKIMQDTPLIPHGGIRRKVSEYYSPFHEVLKEMCCEDEFPPEILRSEVWIRFLKLIGLKLDVPGHLFLGFAREVETGGRFGITTDMARKSEVLVQYLFTHKNNWEECIYQEIACVKFVIPFKVDEQYTRAHKQYSDNKHFICFKNAISSSFAQLVWTSQPLLSKLADPDQYYKQEDKRDALGIYSEPLLEDVIKHVQNICDSLKKKIETVRSDQTESRVLAEELMEQLYDFLQLNGLHSENMKEQLKHTPVVYTPENNLFVPAYRVIQDLSSDQEISPYVLKAPFRYGKYMNLFYYLGAEKHPTYKHYVRVLAMIKDEVRENQLTEEYLTEWGVIRKALENMLHFSQPSSVATVQNTEAKSDIPTLYLPTTEQRLEKSSDLTVADNRYFEHRIGSARKLKYVKNFKAINLTYNMQSLKWLPHSIRPVFLSQVVTERVDTSHIQEVATCLAGHRLESFLHSEHFISGVLRLLKHFQTEEHIILHEKEEGTISTRVQNTRVRQVSGLRTHLYLKEEKIEGSERPKDCFVQQTDKSDKNMPLSIYFQNEFDSELELVQSLSEHLIKYTHDVLSFDKIPEYLIMKLFNKINDPEGISLMLDEVPIDPYDMPTDILQSVFPKPGTYVPVEYHHLLNCDFSDFKPHEYFSVALELEDAEMLDDESDSYTPVYIYVRIERKVPETDASVITQKYEVFTGSEIVVVPAFKIYKFVRPSEARSTDVVDSGNIAQPRSNLDKTKIFYSIRRTLQDAWKLSEEDKRRIIKRLYLKWHPDKNIGNEELCTEVFKYIKEIIYKLEHGIPLDDDDTDGAARQRRTYDDFTCPEYFSFFERMNRRRQRFRDQERTFYAPSSHGQRRTFYGSCFTHTNTSTQPFKDHAEARRWQKQAEIDLRRARETIDVGVTDSPAYNWICYMCHQACEKSLKAAAFARDANTVEKNSHNIVSLAFGFPAAQENVALLANMVGLHTRMRYPDVLSRPHIPSTVYTREQAVTACDLAKNILDCVADNYLS